MTVIPTSSFIDLIKACPPAYLIAAGALLLIIMALAAFIVRYRLNRPARLGARGERKVRRALARLGRREYTMLHDLLIPTGYDYGKKCQRYTQIDHVVVSTRGIFVIETKAHAGFISGMEEAKYWRQNFMLRAQYLYNPLLQNATHIRTLLRKVGDIDPEWVTSIVVFTEASQVRIVAEYEKKRHWWSAPRRRTLNPESSTKGKWWRGTRAVRLDKKKVVLRLPVLVNEISRRPRIIGRDEMKEIAGKIAALNIKDKSARRRHVGNVKKLKGL
ncbi:MAG: NERD domain-containing protein [Bacteroides sp.]|nr:NERD domain-containing protein [Bacteroides sp.]